jgi:peptide chain release factor 1
MLEKLKEASERYDEIESRLTDPKVISDNAAYRFLMKEHKALTQVVITYRSYCEAQKSYDEALEILEDASYDADFKQMAEEQRKQARTELEQLKNKLNILLLPSDPDDDKSCIVEIRGGAGGEEAALFAAALFRMYKMYAESRGWKVEGLGANETELGGFKEVSFLIEGEAAYSRMKYESGVHRVQRVPDTEASGRIHTSTVTVAVLPEAEDIELDINPADLQIDTYRASGAGGQHVNKTDSAIRITHVPTGIVVECQDERSQHKNKEKAMRVLRSRLYEIEMAQQKQEIDSQRRSQVGTGDRSERIRTYNYPQGRVSDHRIGLTLYKLEAILNGSLDEFIDAMITHTEAERLRAASIDPT